MNLGNINLILNAKYFCNEMPQTHQYNEYDLKLTVFIYPTKILNTQPTNPHQNILNHQRLNSIRNKVNKRVFTFFVIPTITGLHTVIIILSPNILFPSPSCPANNQFIYL